MQWVVVVVVLVIIHAAVEALNGVGRTKKRYWVGHTPKYVRNLWRTPVGLENDGRKLDTRGAQYDGTNREIENKYPEKRTQEPRVVLTNQKRYIATRG